MHKLKKTWRPIGFWMLTINAGLGFPAIMILVLLEMIWKYEVANLGVVAAAFTAVLASWCTAAGIRHADKKHKTDEGEIQHDV